MREISDYFVDLSKKKANIVVDTTIYSLVAIRAAAYPFLSNYHILVTPSDDRHSVVIIFEAKLPERDINTDLKEYCNSLLDHQVRVQLDASNGKIRDLIVAHAFSPIDLQNEINSL
ncbi:His-Xaa-Ser system protein HxsD [Prosthecochloris sp. ZM]|uniref:His-Xaa-Ser system protein HxsD n=1 Tax=Prosthecochloris sp. ZM TaxID=2283143 RepID=UPI000DF80F91|nr:His-Xaa-Ser system protein HxsD [Prosthecochloris sp. ZM]RDD30558.1 His-Xaa-Ser system protein HxsD [Prosthecochloris sp. ZM]